jgi:16S rRNA U516 pseudouridylate synthase RsuA-like enzyme
VVKTYVAEVDGRVGGETIESLKKDVCAGGGRTQGAGVAILRRSDKQSMLEIRICEGRNREVRRILARLGHRVRRLKRVAIGPVTARGLKVGTWRMLTDAEVHRLKRCGQATGGQATGAKATGAEPASAPMTAPRRGTKPKATKPKPAKTTRRRQRRD